MIRLKPEIITLFSHNKTEQSSNLFKESVFVLAEKNYKEQG